MTRVESIMKSMIDNCLTFDEAAAVISTMHIFGPKLLQEAKAMNDTDCREYKALKGLLREV
ncbi:hypothetical protein LCGC14_3053610 [marine sediment metagenome]|uniref:Uncharacterized protein n=1 Tax=marine sediment metagenome TaxID=412755 RepID=A0A0F8WLG0_9ZZZZ